MSETKTTYPTNPCVAHDMSITLAPEDERHRPKLPPVRLSIHESPQVEQDPAAVYVEIHGPYSGPFHGVEPGVLLASSVFVRFRDADELRHFAKKLLADAAYVEARRKRASFATLETGALAEWHPTVRVLQLRHPDGSPLAVLASQVAAVTERDGAGSVLLMSGGATTLVADAVESVLSMLRGEEKPAAV